MRFSIITINRNNAAGLRKTIESVVNQSCCDFEYIVIDGASTDGSVDVIKEYANQIDYWISESDNGIYQAMNKGVAVAHGMYCNFMNSGDTFVSNDVLKQVASANKAEDIVCGDLQHGDKSLCISPHTVTMKDFYSRTLYHQASFIKRTLLCKIPYDESLRIVSDWKFFMVALVFNNATYSHIPVTVARFELGGFSSQNLQKSKEEIYSELHKLLPQRVLDDYEDYTKGMSAYQRMMNNVRIIPPLRRIIYKVDWIVLKCLNLYLKSEWVKHLRWKDE